MSSWAVSWERRAIREVKKLDQQHRRRIIETVEEIAADPLRKGRALKGRWTGLWRARVGSYRIIYAADRGQLRILVVRIGHRREVYQD